MFIHMSVNENIYSQISIASKQSNGNHDKYNLHQYRAQSLQIFFINKYIKLTFAWKISEHKFLNFGVK